VNERLLKNVLDAGLAVFTSNANRLEKFFQQEHGLSTAETHKLRTYFEYSPADGEHGGPPTVIHGYPRSTGPFPCWAIILLGDRSQQRVLGDDAGTVDTFDDEENLDGEPAIPLVRLVQHTIAIDNYVPDLSDVCLYYYHLLRHILFQNIGTLQASPNFLQNLEITGQDLAPNPQYLPENMWVRRVTLTFFTEEAAWEDKSEPTSIDGAFVNDGDDQAGITKSITPYEATT
jgi:hypothetical protein